jgi:hypothetical protein
MESCFIHLNYSPNLQISDDCRLFRCYYRGHCVESTVTGRKKCVCDDGSAEAQCEGAGECHGRANRVEGGAKALMVIGSLCPISVG